MRKRCDIIGVMNKKVVRIIAYIATVVMCSMTLTGCGMVPTLELTPEQSTLIAEYAAGKLLEYAKGHPGGLMIVEDIDRAEVNPGMKKEEPAPEGPGPLPGLEPSDEGSLPPDAQTPPDEGTQPPGDEGEVPAPDEDDEALVDAPEYGDEISASMPLGEALGIPGADIKYVSYEVAENYPENGEELAFSMKAASGKRLLVVHFDMTNPGGDDLDVHTNSTEFKARLLVNGTDKVRGDVTFLDNDLMNYSGLLTSGATVDAVLVFEIPEGEEITSMDLLIIRDGQEQGYTLQ